MNESEKKLQHQLYLARENPAPTFDVSNCNLATVPQGSFALCKVLRKKEVYLNDNKIKDLSSNNNKLSDLIVVTHLFLQSNHLVSIPNDISRIQYLEILNLSDNYLTQIPNCLGDLKYLRKLYLKNNKLKDVPVCLCYEGSKLVCLDVRQNQLIRKIPTEVIKLKQLEIFLIDTTQLSYPQSILSQSLPEIINFACKSIGNQLDETVYQRLLNENVDTTDNDRSVVDANVLEYEVFKQKRINYLQSIEQECNKLMDQYNHLMHKSSSERDLFLKRVLEEEAKINQAISRLNFDRELRKKKLLDNVKAAENDVRNLIDEIQAINKACQRQDKIFDKIEEERLKKFHEYQIYKDGVKQLRKKEILDAMSQMLESHDKANKAIQNKIIQRQNMKEILQANESKTDDTMDKILRQKENHKNELVCEIEKENVRQREAFQELQLRKDMHTLRLIEEINWVESELQILTQMEIKKRREINNQEMDLLGTKRKELVQMLELLFQQKSEREKELQKRLIEMEDHRQKTQTDYWLVQYQRLLDSKPYQFQEENCPLDTNIIEVLRNAEAQEYLPFFQRQKITWLQLLNFTDEELIGLCVTSKSKRKAIMNEVKSKMKRKQNISESNLTKYNKKSNDTDDLKKPTNHILQKITKSPFKKQASLPEMFVDEQEEESEGACQSRGPEMTKISINVHYEEECCICMAVKGNALFIQCGHICCCSKCSVGLQECPLCRQPIEKIIILEGIWV